MQAHYEYADLVNGAENPLLSELQTLRCTCAEPYQNPALSLTKTLCRRTTSMQTSSTAPTTPCCPSDERACKSCGSGKGMGMIGLKEGTQPRLGFCAVRRLTVSRQRMSRAADIVGSFQSASKRSEQGLPLE